MDKLRALTVYRRVIELGSFKAASDDLNLLKAAISKSIYELEDYLQSPLINRTTRKLCVTAQTQSDSRLLTLTYSDGQASTQGVEQVNQVLKSIGVRVSTETIPEQAKPVIAQAKRRVNEDKVSMV